MVSINFKGKPKYEVVRSPCPYCPEKILGIILHNATSEPEDWIELIDVELGDPRIEKVRRLFKVKSKKLKGETGYLPTGVIGNIIHNFVRDRVYMYYYLKGLFE